MKKLTILGEELNVKLSHSFINNAACPFYLKCNYVDKVESRYIRVASERGRAIHEAIEAVLKECIEDGVSPSDVPDGLLREAVQAATPHEILSEVGLIFEWLRLWAAKFRLPSKIVGIEAKIGLDDSYNEVDFGDASYRGIIDLFQLDRGHAIITDWKSQPNIFSQGELDENEQLDFYCWLAWKLYPDEIEKFTARIWYLRYGFYGETVRTEDDLDAFEHRLLIKEKKISEIQSWDPIPGKHCQYCEYILQCPIALDLSPENPEIISQAQAVIAAQKVTVMDTLTKELKAGLKEYVKANDDVLIGDNWVYGYHESISDVWDPVEMSEVLSEYGHDLSEVANLDSRKVKKLLKEAAKDDPGLEAAVMGIRKEKHRTTFKGAQRKE